MRSGKLDNVIEVKRETLVDDGYGNQVPGGPPETIATLRAQIIETSTEEFVRSWGISADRLRIFRTRFLDGVLMTDIVVHNGSQYDLKELKPIGRRRGLELRCVERIVN
ncbi:head-tail adaptor protein [Sinorhizobium medicae]|uniref:head-tail adaptor protein n=1 Tax=Sinorhizobium medicae TaxID=110321 RepID=UPI00040E6DB6|nr:head-tail adaptor protein [Sinorhizobium medicae]